MLVLNHFKKITFALEEWYFDIYFHNIDSVPLYVLFMPSWLLQYIQRTEFINSKELLTKEHIISIILT